jgi:hypothetical protein
MVARRPRPGRPSRPGIVGGRGVVAVVALLVGAGALWALWALWAPAPARSQAADFVFTAAGDFGAGGDAAATLSAIGRAGAAFHLALGDLSYGQLAPEAAWCDFVKQRVGATFPFELVAGNHDEDGSGQGRIRNFAACLPHRLGPLVGTYGKEYYFDHNGLARFILISPDLVLDGEAYAYTKGSARSAWLAGAIDGARAAGLSWVVVGMHKTCVTIGEKSCEIGTDLLDLLVVKRVDLVLQAHDHTYQRSKQLAHGPACAAVPVSAYTAACVADDGAAGTYAQDAGTVLVVAGTGGRPLYSVHPGDAQAGYFAAWMGANAKPRRGFLRVAVSAAQLAAEFVGTTGTSGFADRFAITAGAPASTPTPTPPAPPPGAASLSASPDSVAPGGAVTVAWSGVPNPTATDWFGLYAPGAADADFLDWRYVSCSQAPDAARESGSCAYTMPAAAGTYEFRLFAADGPAPLAASGPVAVGAAAPTSTRSGAVPLELAFFAALTAAALRLTARPAGR